MGAVDTLHEGGFEDLLDAIEQGGVETPAQRIERKLIGAFREEGIVSPRVAAAVAHRFCRYVLGGYPGETPEHAGARLGCSAKSVRRALEHVERLASGRFLKPEQLLGEVSND